MTNTETETTATQPEEGRYMSPARFQQLLAAIALGDENYRLIAMRFGRTHQYGRSR